MRRYLIPWGRVFSSRGHAFDSAIVAAFYFVFKCVRCASGVSGGYVFESKVEVVNAFDSKILARAMRVSGRAIGEKTACLSRGVEHRLGHGGLLSKTEKPAGKAGFFSFSILSSVYHAGGGKTAKTL
jgi:hypothetical protein